MFSRFLGNQTYWNLFLFFTIFPLPYIVISETGIRISYSRSGSNIIYALQWLIFIFLVYCFQGNIDYLKSTFNQTSIVLQTLVKFPQRSEQRRRVGKTSIEKARYDPEKLYRTIWTSLDFQSQLIQIDEYWTKCSQILDLKIDHCVYSNDVWMVCWLGIIKATDIVGNKAMSVLSIGPAVRFLTHKMKDPGNRGGTAF